MATARHAITALLGLLFSMSVPGAQTPVENFHRLYDLTPVSAANPVLASVKGCAVEIPVSEFQGFLNMYLVYADGKKGELTLAEKHHELERLLDDHFYLWGAYQKKADQIPGLVNTLKSTENLLSAEMLMTQEIGSKAKTPEEYQKLSNELRQRIFDQADIRVSNPAYETLKAAAKHMNETGAAAARDTNHIAQPSIPADGLTDRERSQPLAACVAGTITIGDFLSYYSQTPAVSRPDLAKQDALIKCLEDMFGDGLLVAEARKRGLEKATVVREKLQQNRNVLMRLWFLDQITAQTSAAMNEPETEMRLKQWYDSHVKSLYTYQGKNGNEQVQSFEANHDSIRNDYFEDLQDHFRADAIRLLRKGPTIHINEELLKQVAVLWPSPPPPISDLPPTESSDANPSETFLQPGQQLRKTN